jgi:hypothetical protein
MRKTRIALILKNKYTSLKTKTSLTPTVCPLCGTQIAPEDRSILELVTDACCVILLACVTFPAVCAITRCLDHVIQDLPVHLRSPELIHRWNWEVWY